MGGQRELCVYVRLAYQVFHRFDTCDVQARAQCKVVDIVLMNCGTLESGRFSAASFWQSVTKLFGWWNMRGELLLDSLRYKNRITIVC